MRICPIGGGLGFLCYHDAALCVRRIDRREALARVQRGEAPTAEELAAAPRLNFGGVVEIQDTSALIVTDHPNLRQGAKIVTTSLLWASEDWSAARTVSRFYRLGVPLSDEPTLESQDMRQCNGSIGPLLGKDRKSGGQGKGVSVRVKFGG